MDRTARSRAVRRVAAATIAVLGLAGLTACGNGNSTATDTAASASATSSESPSSTPSSTSSPTAGETVDPAAFVHDVLYKLIDASTAHVTLKLEGGPAEVTMAGDVDYSAIPPMMSLTMTNESLGTGEIQMRLVDGVMYVQIPQLGNGKWVRMPLKGNDTLASGKLLDMMNPGAALEAVKGAVDEVTYVGDEDVHGETLHHYTMKVRSEAFRELQDKLGSSADMNLPSVVNYDVWTDDQGLMRQTKLALGDLGTVTMTLSGWGEPVTIEAPPADDVVKMPNGMPMMG